MWPLFNATADCAIAVEPALLTARGVAALALAAASIRSAAADGALAVAVTVAVEVETEGVDLIVVAADVRRATSMALCRVRTVIAAMTADGFA